MLRDVTYHAHVGEDVELFATVSGPNLTRRFFFEEVNDRRGGFIRFFAPGSQVRVSADGVEYQGNGGVVAPYMFGAEMPVEDLLYVDAATFLVSAVTLSLGASGASWMQISNDGVFDTEPWVAYSGTSPWTLSGGDGVHTVSARFADDAGRIRLFHRERNRSRAQDRREGGRDGRGGGRHGDGRAARFERGVAGYAQYARVKAITGRDDRA